MIESARISLQYIKKLEYTGGYKGMRYMIKKGSQTVKDENGEETKKDILNVYFWPEPLCFVKTDKSKIEQKEFPLSPEGKEEAVKWLNQMHEQHFSQ